MDVQCANNVDSNKTFVSVKFGTIEPGNHLACQTTTFQKTTLHIQGLNFRFRKYFPQGNQIKTMKFCNMYGRILINKPRN